jgi:large subunit ribosomal protein L10
MMLGGPTAIAFIESSGDPAAVAKALWATSRETDVLTLRGGVLEGRTLSGDEVAQLATLPPLDVLRAQLVGAIVAPLTQLLALVSAPLRDLHGLIDARIAQLEEEGQVVAEPVGTTAEPEPESETVPDADEMPINVEGAAEGESGSVSADRPTDSAAAESVVQEAPDESEADDAPAEQPDVKQEEE